MSQTAMELSEVKAIIRGLLISSTAATSIRQLEYDYKKQEGITIPFRSFGYPSAEAFLRSIPDTVNLRESSRGCPSSLWIVEPVQSEKSEHVEKMVTRQKTSKPIRGMKRCSAIPELKAPKRTGKDSSRLNGMAPRFIPLALRTSLCRVCQRHSPHGLPLCSLGMELSRDLSMAGWAEGGKSGWLNTNGFSSIQEVIDGLTDQGLIKITTRNGQEWVISNIDSEIDRHKTSCEMERRRSIMNSQLSPDSEVVPAGSEMLSGDEWSDDEAESLVSDRMKKNFRDILAEHPDGLWCAALPHEYKKHTGGDLDVKQLGFVSIVQMASRLKDVFICSRPDTNSDWLLFDSNSNALWNCSAAPTGRSGNQLPTLPSKFIRNVESLLEDHPQGIERAKFLDAYKAKYNEDFPLIDFGFENLMALLGHLDKRKIVHLRFSGYVPMVYKPYSYSAGENLFAGFKKDGDFISALYPMEVVGCNTVIPIQPLPEGLQPGCSFDIQVTEVKSPTKFWFQIWDTELKEEFESMMDNMQEFYNSDGPSVYKMPDAIIMIGQYCATRFPPKSYPNSEWHRAIITSLPSLSEAEVFYVDYGSTMKLLRSEIYFLDLRFSKLPLQALRARLTNIRPVGYGLWKKLRNLPKSEEMCNIKPTWPRSCVPFFVDLINNLPSVAAVTHIRKSDNCLSLGLTDTNGDEDKHINDKFVEARLAEFGEMTDDEDFPSLGPLRPASERPASRIEYESPSPQKTPLPLISPGGPSSPLPPQRPIMTENGYHSFIHDKASPLESSYSPASPIPPMLDNSLGKGLDVGQSVKEYLREQLLMKAQREEGEMRLRELLEEQQRLDEARRLEEERIIEGERRMEEVRRRLEEQRRMEEARQVEEQRRVEKQRRVEEARRMEEQRMLLEQRRLEEKAKQEAQLRLELQKLQIQQRLLDLQHQQYQAQLLLLNTQNTLGNIMPSEINPLLGSQPCLPAPPPGMMNMMPLPNIQAGFPQLLPGTVQGSSLPSGMTTPLQNLTSFGNFPYQNQAYPQWNNVGNGFGKPLPYGFLGAGDNLSSKHNVYTPPGFENYSSLASPLQVTNIAKTPIFSSPGLVSSGIASSESGNLAEKPETEHVVFKELKNTAENCSNKSPTANLNSLPKLDNSSLKAESPVVIPTNSPKTASIRPIDSENLDMPVNIPDTATSPSPTEAVAESPVNIPKTSINHQIIKTSSKILSAKVASRTNPNKSEVVDELSTMLKSCDISSSDNCDPSAIDGEYKNQKDFHMERKKVQCVQEKWRVKIQTSSSEDRRTVLKKGCVNGKTVNVIKVDDDDCILTEEILSLFFNDLPVHVALKIADLKPNGNKIVSVTLNPWKDRNLCREIARLNVIEINPRGSDVHLITIESLHYLCLALGDPA